MSILEAYQKAIANGEFIADPNQAEVVNYLQQLANNFIEAHASKWSKLISNITRRKKTPIIGLYLWGGVGAGKTWLMDLFFDNLPTDRKLRLHFHRFMQQVHQRLTALQGVSDPLKEVAKEFAAEADILCFDEFIVQDITDAMVLANLFEALFANGLTLVTTSNMTPDQLYRNGLQRTRFLPAIELIKKYTHTIHLQSLQDYRLRVLTEASIYFTPLNETTTKQMELIFNEYTHGRAQFNSVLLIADREIPTLAVSNQVVWFEFNNLCHVPRSQIDYLEIAQDFHTVFLSNVTHISSNRDDLIVYLITLIDVLYDAKVKLIMSAEVPVAELYTHGRYSFEFERTKSRLLEMQSLEYLKTPHLGG